MAIPSRFDKPDGFYIVSYDNQNLGFVKATQGRGEKPLPQRLKTRLVKSLTNRIPCAKGSFLFLREKLSVQVFIFFDLMGDEVIGDFWPARSRFCWHNPRREGLKKVNSTDSACNPGFEWKGRKVP
jgi:hypothetical protein